MSTQFIIVYAAESKAIRRVIYPDDDNQQIAISDGEAVLVCPIKQKGDLFQWKALVEQATGVYPPDPLCAVVDPKDNTVLSVIMADPNLDTHPDGHDLVAAYSDEIAAGDSYDKAAGLFIKAAYVAPEYTDRTTKEIVPAQLVPAIVIDKPLATPLSLK